MALANKVIYQNGAIREFEKPEVCEAIKVANANKWTVSLSPLEWYKREARLKKEREKHANALIPGSPALKEAASQFNDALLDEQTKQIDKQNKEITRLLSLVEKKENSISRLYYEKSVLEKENEDLKKGEIPAKYFDKALVDEQAEKIKKLEHEKLNILEMASSCKQTVAERGKEISRLNKAIYKKNMKIEEFRKESSRQLRGKIKMLVENRGLEGKLKDKDAVLSDVAEELRLTKIREKNLTEVCQKYMKENEKLKKELADKVVDKIDAQALKSAESALAEKDEVIVDLGKELAATKKELEEKIKQVETVRNASKQYCEYGIAAEKMIQKMANVIVYGKPVSSEDFKEYRRWANGYRYNPQLSDFIEEEEKKLTAKTLDFNAKCMKAARESINDVFESYAAKYAKSSLDDLKEKAYNSFNAKACKLGLVGSKDGNGILDQMAGVDVGEEGADQSGKIVICGKDFAKILKENEEAAEELFKVLDDAIDQFLLFGEIIIKTEK